LRVIEALEKSNAKVQYRAMGEDRKTDDNVVTVTGNRQKVQSPKQFRVVLLNDDYTPMDFVVNILETIFRKSPSEAVRIMLEVHQKGKGVCGVYTRQIAEVKIAEVRERARSEGHPLQATMEEVS
jgi:ATP-dependent Clp protease adaptor protein ClpS